MEKIFKVLSIDGGGIRGVYPATVLKYITEHLEVKSIYEYFDMIVGTSTGSIIALALSIDKEPNDLQKMYTERGSEIFNKISIRWLNKGIILPKYSNSNLKQVIYEYFGEMKLGDAKTRVCIPASDVTNKKGIVYKTRHLPELKSDYKKPMKEIAMASCSAPMYFPAFEDSTKSILVDGGLWANNPSVIGITEAIRLGYSFDNIKVLSLGTGSSLFYKSRFSMKSFGIIAWKTSLIDYIFQINSINSHHVASFLLNQNYIRLNKQLETNNFKLDKTSGNTIKDLISYANEDAKNNINNLHEMFFDDKVKPFKPIPLNTGE